jgi:hypothetical protein
MRQSKCLGMQILYIGSISQFPQPSGTGRCAGELNVGKTSFGQWNSAAGGILNHPRPFLSAL